jgi:hypothetical protein
MSGLRGSAAMKSIERSFLMRLLATSALPLAVVTAGAPQVCAENVVVPTVPGSLEAQTALTG